MNYRVINYLIALVWFINGLVCKVLNFVPRHEQIVARILGNVHSFILIKMIGLAEIVMVVWIISGYKSRFNALTQIFIIAIMNVIEFILAPDLLLWGGFNIVFAFILIAIIYVNEFYIVRTNVAKKY